MFYSFFPTEDSLSVSFNTELENDFLSNLNTSFSSHCLVKQISILNYSLLNGMEGRNIL